MGDGDVDFSIVFGSQEEAIAYFDRLGLLVYDCDLNDPIDEVVPPLFHLVTLLRSLVPRGGQHLKRVIAIQSQAPRSVELIRAGGGWVARWVEVGGAVD